MTVLTYPEHGATRGPLPPGYRHVLRRVHIGDGRAAFQRATEALFTWQMHRGAGLTVLVAPPVRVGEVVVTRLGPPVLGPTAPCRIVWVENEPRRRGFAYGTLPGHPARGEEAFVVEWTEDDEVVLSIRAFSRFVAPWAWFGALLRPVQDFATARFIAALRRLATR